MKPSLCKICGGDYIKRSMGHKVCSPDCAKAIALAVRNKAERKVAAAERVKDRATRERLKTRQQWLKEAETVVNRYVRLRDQYAGLDCISCDRTTYWEGQWHASHFKAVGANSALRYNLWNIHRSCSVCNNHLSGNIAAYSKRLPAKIGQERFDWLETQNQSVKYEIDYLKRLKAVFAKKCRRMEKRIESQQGESACS